MHYPNGKPFVKKEETKQVNIKASLSAANRGISLENDINISNDFYRENNLCLITKRPTPINVVKVDYSRGAKIVNAYFEKQSTTDYNGVYKSRYIDFEAKSTKNKTSFPLSNISLHQIKHLKQVLFHGGIAFFIIEFASHNKVFLLDATYVIYAYENGNRKSIRYEDICRNGNEIKRGYLPRLDYLPIVKEKYKII
mgnify:CR=1 FL=1